MADSYQLKAILSAVDKMSPTLKAIANQAKTTRKYLGDVGSSVSNLTSKLGVPIAALSALSAGFSIGAIKHAVEGFAETSESLIKLSLRSGIAAEQLQRLKYVAEQSGVDAEALAGGIGKLNVNIGNAVAGKNKDLVGLFKRLNISLRDANGQIRSGADMLPQLADAFVKNENPVIRARMGMALFGKKWQELVPLLADGSDEITRSLERFKRLKGIIPEASLREGKELGDKLADLDFILKGFQNTIARELIPVLTPVIEDFVMWGAANKKMISVEVKAFVQGLVEAIKSFDWSGFVQALKDIGGALKSVAEFFGGTRNAVIALVVFMNLQAISAFVGLIGSVGRLGWSLGSLAAKQIPSVISGLGSLTGSLGSASAAASGLLGKLGAIGAAGAAGYGVGTLLNEYVINPLAEKSTGVEGETLGTWLYGFLGKDTYDPNANSTPLRTSAQKVQGSVTVNFENAPPGMRVGDSLTTPGFSLDPTVGYRSAATGG